MILRLLAAVLSAFLLFGASGAAAHEVRPALVQIVETAPGDYEVTWKRPVVGDMALRLVPHLSSGALEAAPIAEQASPGHFIRTWRIRNGKALDGQTLSIDGLDQSVTDVLIRIALHDGRTFDYVLRPSSPKLTLNLAPAKGLAVPGYLKLGVEHILTGFDHLAFVFGLLLLIGPRWRLVKAVTAFTVAHSITLALAALGWIKVSSAAIEALVALSILFLAVEIARPDRDTLARRHPWVVAFAFGLLHGLAFAGALAAIGLPPKAAAPALLLFNVGVEIGQLAFISVVAGLWLLLRRVSLSVPTWSQPVPTYAIGALAAFWLIERTLAAFA